MFDAGPHGGIKGEQVGFGDLQMEPLGGYTGLLEPLTHRFGEVGMAQGGRCHVGRHKEVCWQGRQGRDALTQHLQIDFHRQVAAAGGGQEAIGGLNRAVGLDPAHQRLVADQLAFGDGDHGHEPGLERIGGQG